MAPLFQTLTCAGWRQRGEAQRASSFAPVAFSTLTPDLQSPRRVALQKLCGLVD
jgi:hypothetical protein